MFAVFRRRYFIYPEIQKPLIKQVVIGLTLLNLVQVLCLFLTMKWIESLVQGNISLVVDLRILGVWQKLIYVSVIVPVLFNIVISLFITLYVSNRFAGPLFRLEREIDHFLAGNTNNLDVSFRKSDYLHSLSRKVNRLAGNHGKNN